MSTPRVKRPFAGAASDPSQRQITSFFQTRSPADQATTPDSLRSPPLPANIESNLLSVGMRIRKSVPEGYKTSTHSAFKLWTDNTPLPRSGTAAAAPASSKAASRELMPFCGINSVGGLNSQPEFSCETDFDDHEVPGLDDVPELTLSQESTDSTASSCNMRKRIYDEDDAEESPDSNSRNLTMGYSGNARVMAIPRSRVAKRSGNTSLKNAVDQENMAIDDDFEDADFLVYGGGNDMDMME